MCLGIFYESPVMSVIEGTGFHPFVVPMYRDGGLYESPVMSIFERTGFHPFVVPVYRDGGYNRNTSPCRQGMETNFFCDYHQRSAAVIYPHNHCVGWALPNTKQTFQDMVWYLF
jgi:hypothetical protein